MSSFFIKRNLLVKYYTYQILDEYLTKSKKGRHLLRQTLKSEMCNSSLQISRVTPVLTFG